MKKIKIFQSAFIIMALVFIVACNSSNKKLHQQNFQKLLQQTNWLHFQEPKEQVNLQQRSRWRCLLILH